MFMVIPSFDQSMNLELILKMELDKRSNH